MRALGRGALTALALLIAATACRDTPTDLGSATPAPRSSQGAQLYGATVDEVIPAYDAIPVSAPCLGSSELLSAYGTWHVRWRANVTQLGQIHEVDYIDYSDIVLHRDGETWEPAPGATEVITYDIPGNESSAKVVSHDFHARYLSQDGLSDLLVSHRIKVVFGPDGTTRQFYIGIPFTAECIGA